MILDVQAVNKTFVQPGLGSLRVLTDVDFSIDRQGISLLMDTLQTMTANNCRIRITGLSYNYLRFFEMAGIDKLAQLTQAVTEEPGI